MSKAANKPPRRLPGPAGAGDGEGLFTVSLWSLV